MWDSCTQQGGLSSHKKTDQLCNSRGRFPNSPFKGWGSRTLTNCFKLVQPQEQWLLLSSIRRLPHNGYCHNDPEYLLHTSPPDGNLGRPCPQRCTRLASELRSCFILCAALSLLPSLGLVMVKANRKETNPTPRFLLRSSTNQHIQVNQPQAMARL